MIWKNRHPSTVLLWLYLLVIACDPLHKDKCEWYLEPDPEHRHLVAKDWVSVCVRNFVINRQKCLLKLPLAEMEKIIGKPVKYSSLQLKESEFPREIISYTLCSP